MENYIVRIYRRDAVDPRKVVGIFECVEEETVDSFTHLNGLVSLLETTRVDKRHARDEASMARSRALTD